MNNNSSENAGSNNLASEPDYSPKVISKLCVAIAVLSIAFFPIAGCGGEKLSGLTILGSDRVDGEIKMFLVVASLCGIIILFLTKFKQMSIFAIGGFVSLIIALLIAKGKPYSDAIKLEPGAYIAFLGYIVSALIGLFSDDSFNKHEHTQPVEGGAKGEGVSDILGLVPEPGNVFTTVSPAAYDPPAEHQEDTDMIAKLKQLKSLLDEGILTPEEYQQQKNNILK